MLIGDRTADLAHLETPPPLVGGNARADAIIPGRIRSKEKGRKWRNKFIETSKLLQCPACLGPRLYAPTPVADPDSIGETCQLDFGRF